MQDKKALIASIVSEYENTLSVLEDAYTAKEIQTWPQQIVEARAYRLDAQTETPFIDGMLLTRQDVTKEALVTKIITNYTNYSDMVGAALGTMQAAVKAVEEEYSE